jgi:hypothetical protein
VQRGSLALVVGSLLTIGCYSGFRGDPGEGDDPPAASGGDAADDTGGGDEGGSGDDDGGVPTGCDGKPVSVASRPIRRLTPVQYVNTMRDLLGDPGFDADYDDIEAVPTERGIRQLRSGAESAIARIEAWSAAQVPCDLDGPEDAACPQAVIDTFAPRAFRRPLTELEEEWLASVYDAANGELGFRSGMEALLSTILQSPAFVYHVELGNEDADGPIRALTPHEVANRLSYFLWDSMPDDALFDAAAAGNLDEQSEVRAQVARMMADPRAEAKMQAFIWHWLQLDGGRAHFALGEQTKSAEYFPEYTEALVHAMGVEVEALVQRVLFEGDADFDRLLTSREAYVNASLAELYDVQNAPADDDTWAWVELDPEFRSGLLTRAAFLSTFAAPDVQSPIRRGVYVFEELLCGHLGEPPPNASDVPVGGGDVDGEILSVREEVELRTQDAECAACHNVINNIGFPFEHYDAVGRWRATEVTSGREIDASGRLIGSDVDGEVANAIEMSELLASSTKVKECFADRWFTEAIGGEADEEDDCSVNAVRDRFAESASVVDLMTEIALSDTFRFINADGGEE